MKMAINRLEKAKKQKTKKQNKTIDQNLKEEQQK